MRFEIRTAALDQAFEQRLKIATSLLAAYKIDTRMETWSGTRCHLLIAASDDTYGQKAIGIAHRRSTPVLAVGSPGNAAQHPAIQTDAPAVDIARRIREMLKSAAPASTSASMPDSNPLQGLFGETWKNRPVDIVLDRRVVYVRPDAGRIYARTHSDLIVMQTAFKEASEDLRLKGPGTVPEDVVSTSLEAYLLQIAYEARDRLARFSDGTYRLKAWPDLGSAPKLRAAMAVVARLIQRGASPGELENEFRESDTAPLVQPCLWAFSTAGLLHAKVPTTTHASRPGIDERKQGIWASIARHFGLQR